MKPSHFFLIDYQRQLIFAGLEDFSANAALPNLCGGQYGEHSSLWRSAVIEFICTNIKCGLLDVVNYPGKPETLSPSEILGILTDGDENRGLDAQIVWDVLYFTGTEKLKGVLAKLSLLNWEAINGGENAPLISYLKEAYQTR